MIEVFGPTYRYNGEILKKPEVLYVNDHHFQEDTKQWHVKTLLENSEILQRRLVSKQRQRGRGGEEDRCSRG